MLEGIWVLEERCRLQPLRDDACVAAWKDATHVDLRAQARRRHRPRKFLYFVVRLVVELGHRTCADITSVGTPEGFHLPLRDGSWPKSSESRQGGVRCRLRC